MPTHIVILMNVNPSTTAAELFVVVKIKIDKQSIGYKALLIFLKLYLQNMLIKNIINSVNSI